MEHSWGCQGKACDGAAWAHAVMVVATKGRGQAAAPLLDFGKALEAGKEGAFPFPFCLHACWCASCEGWRLLEADGCAPPGCSGAATAAKLMLVDLLEKVACRISSMRL